MTEVVRTVGRYEIVRRLGRGGMAVVHLARQPDLDRQVALKELNALDADDPSYSQRFLRESRLAGSLSHPNVVTVLDYFEYDGTPYIAMEYVERGSLRPYVGCMTLAQIAGVLEGILAALVHAEEQGIVHRDLKPENVLVAPDGRVKIADFGIAKAVNQVSATGFQTATGMTVGTPAYMAPEQAMAGRIGPWTDLYAVGCMAHEFFVGKVPFAESENPMALLIRRINESIPPAHAANAALPHELSEWIDRLLVKDPEQRTQSAATAFDDLEDVVIGLIGPRWRRVARLPPSVTADDRRDPFPLEPGSALTSSRRFAPGSTGSSSALHADDLTHADPPPQSSRPEKSVGSTSGHAAPSGLVTPPPDDAVGPPWTPPPGDAVGPPWTPPPGDAVGPPWTPPPEEAIRGPATPMPGEVVPKPDTVPSERSVPETHGPEDSAAAGPETVAEVEAREPTDDLGTFGEPSEDEFGPRSATSDRVADGAGEAPPGPDSIEFNGEDERRDAGSTSASETPARDEAPDPERATGAYQTYHAPLPLRPPSAEDPEEPGPSLRRTDSLGGPPSRASQSRTTKPARPAGPPPRQRHPRGSVSSRRIDKPRPSDSDAADEAALAPTLAPRAASGALPHEQRGSTRNARKPAAIAVAALALAGVAAGILALAIAGGKDAKPLDPDPGARLTSGRFRLQTPPGWKKLPQPPTIAGLKLTDATAAAPSGRKESGAVLLGLAPESAHQPSLLSDQFLAALKVRAATMLDREVVDLRGNVPQAYRYNDLSPPGLRSPIFLYAAPTSGGIATIVCVPPTTSDSRFARSCQGSAGSLAASGVKAFRVGPSRSYAARLDGALGRLNSALRRERALLRRARRAAEQASAAARIASAYGSAARPLSRLELSPRDVSVNERLIASLAAARSAYRALSTAASKADKSAYRRASGQARRSEAAVASSLEALSSAGYAKRIGAKFEQGEIPGLKPRRAPGGDSSDGTSPGGGTTPGGGTVPNTGGSTGGTTPGAGGTAPGGGGTAPGGGGSTGGGSTGGGSTGGGSTGGGSTDGT